jgi:hypothetical protein
MSSTRPSSVHGPVAWRLAGVVLAVGMLSACSSGAGGSVAGSSSVLSPGSPSEGTTGLAPGSTAADTTAAAEGTTAPAAESPIAAPPPLPTGKPVVTDTPRPTTTDVVLSYAGWDEKTSAVEAAGYLSPVVESGGVCTLQLTKDSRTVTAAAPAQADASTTSCGDLAVPRAKLTPGAWTAVLRYASKATTGSSDPTSVAVPR